MRNEGSEGSVYAIVYSWWMRVAMLVRYRLFSHLSDCEARVFLKK